MVVTAARVAVRLCRPPAHAGRLRNCRRLPNATRPSRRAPPHAPQQGDSPPSQLPWSLGKKVRSGGGFSSHHSPPPNTQHRRTHPTIYYAAFSNLGFSVVTLVAISWLMLPSRGRQLSLVVVVVNAYKGPGRGERQVLVQETRFRALLSACSARVVSIRIRDSTCCSVSLSASDVEVTKRVPSLPVVKSTRARSIAIASARARARARSCFHIMLRMACFHCSVCREPFHST